MSSQRIAVAILAAGLVAAACAAQETGAPPMTTSGSPGSTERSVPTVQGVAPTTAAASTRPAGSTIVLPSPRTDGRMSLEAALARRRSVREFTAEALSRADIGQLLWAARGVTGPGGLRTAPSAGALYPLETYAVTADGLFHYLPNRHALEPIRWGDMRSALGAAALGQASVGEAPLVIVFASVAARTEAKYGERTSRYVALEAGHAAQNVLLQAVALGLGGVPVGAFVDASVARVIGLPPGEEPLYLLPVGHPR